MYPTGNSFWVAYKQHNFTPTLLDDAGPGQEEQRNSALAYIKNWGTCIDIGSQYGFWTRPLLQKFKTVHCFEPNILFRECFLKNIPQDKVKLYPYGLSNKEESIYKATHELVNFRWCDGQEVIKCRSLDSFKIKNVDFIKIDVDGFEDKVLLGAKRTIRKYQPVINIEMKPKKRKLIVNRCRNYLIKKLRYKREERNKSDEIWVKK